MPNDLNKYTSETIRRLVYGTLIILFTVGLGLIWLFYGVRAAGLGLLCLISASIPVLLVIGVIFGMDFFMKRIDKK